MVRNLLENRPKHTNRLFQKMELMLGRCIGSVHELAVTVSGAKDGDFVVCPGSATQVEFGYSDTV